MNVMHYEFNCIHFLLKSLIKRRKLGQKGRIGKRIACMERMKRGRKCTEMKWEIILGQWGLSL
jgi:hypothetical protein